MAHVRAGIYFLSKLFVMGTLIFIISKMQTISIIEAIAFALAIIFITFNDFIVIDEIVKEKKRGGRKNNSKRQKRMA